LTPVCPEHGMRLLPLLGLVGVSLACSPGCRGGGDKGVIPPARYDPDASVSAAFAAYDKNGNGTLEGAELDACPALKAALASLDTNRDGRISRDELKARFEQYAKGGTETVVIVGVTAHWDRRPLPGAVVTLTPEPFMGQGFKPASGTTDEQGFTDVRVEGESRSGVPAGFYKITVSKKDAAGTETLPPRYNARTALGREVYESGRGSGGSFDLNLTGRP
jgi:hypothetical protein